MSEIVTSNVVLDMPQTKAWSILKDFSLAHHYVPGVRKTEITTEKQSGVGASRRVYGQQTLDETITEWNEGKSFTIKLHKGNKNPSPFKAAKFTYRCERLDDNRSKMTLIMVYELGLLGKILNSLFLGKVIRKQIRDIALSMKHFYETGKSSTSEDIERLRKEYKTPF
jgi:hypothetical protein